MRIDLIHARSIRSALRAIRRGGPLAPSRLVELDVVARRLRDGGLQDTPSTREWVLCQLLEGLIRAALTGAPDADAALGAVDPEILGSERATVFSSADSTRQAWLVVYWHHVVGTGAGQLQDLAAHLDISSRTLTRRLEQGYLLLARDLAEAERSADEPPGAGLRSARDVIVPDEGARPRELIELLSDMLSILRDPRAVARFTREQLGRVAVHPAADILAYRLGRIACWSRPEHRLHEAFVPLDLLVDAKRPSAAGRWSSEATLHASLGAVLAERSEPLLVLLGAPGAGKTSLLRQLELAIAEDGVRAADPHRVPITFLVPLGQQPAAGPAAPAASPADWLAARWSAEHPHMPDLGSLLAAGRILLLLDGLNEIAVPIGETLHDRIGHWKRYLHDPAFLAPGNRAIIACRSLDFSSTLSTPDLTVPHVRIEPMRDEQIQDALRRADPVRAAAHWTSIARGTLHEILRSPFFLRVYLDLAADVLDGVPDGPGLLTAWIRAATLRELMRDNPALAVAPVLSDADRARLIRSRPFRSPPRLPEDGPLFPGLTRLALRMQSLEFQGEARAVRLTVDDALKAVGSSVSQEVLTAGEAIGVLVEDRSTGEIHFAHQRFQEYFAARALRREPDPLGSESRWRPLAAPLGLPEILETLGDREHLPQLPQTGWEETIVMAAAMTDRPDAFLERVAARHLGLAGRCVTEGGLAGRCAPETIATLCRALAEHSRSPAADVRERIACARVLAEIGDPRLDVRTSPDGAWTMPSWVELAGGVYPIGADEPLDWYGHRLDDHLGRHAVAIGPLAIGRTAVSNAEWARFIAADGYHDPRWWPGEAATDWWSGRLVRAGEMANERDWRATYRREPELLERSLRQGSLTEAEHERWRLKLAMSDAAFEAHIAAVYPERRVLAPAFWADDRFNHPSQPVVGISWFEARAYCLWLSACAGLPVRLPTEVEWEAAARGLEGRRFPHGDDLGVLEANTVASHLFQPSPCGVFPASDTPTGIRDLAGNTWDWTASAFSGGESTVSFRYPYVADDGRERDELPSATRRVTRGGSWFDPPSICTTWIRGSNRAGHPGRILGLRLAMGMQGRRAVV